jgi:non-heme chloroperoxidase
MPYIQTADRTTLVVTEWGSGAPVVFTHAWGLVRSVGLSDQIHPRPRRRRAALRTLRSPRPRPFRPSRDAIRLRTLPDDLAAAIEHFDLHHVTLVGHSLGTRELVRYLTRHADADVDRMVIVGPATPMLRQTTDNPTAGIRPP